MRPLVVVSLPERRHCISPDRTPKWISEASTRVSDQMALPSSTFLPHLTSTWPDSTPICPPRATQSSARPSVPPCGSGSCTRPRRRALSFLYVPLHHSLLPCQTPEHTDILHTGSVECGHQTRTGIAALVSRYYSAKKQESAPKRYAH